MTTGPGEISFKALSKLSQKSKWRRRLVSQPVHASGDGKRAAPRTNALRDIGVLDAPSIGVGGIVGADFSPRSALLSQMREVAGRVSKNTRERPASELEVLLAQLYDCQRHALLMALSRRGSSDEAARRRARLVANENVQHGKGEAACLCGAGYWGQ